MPSRPRTTLNNNINTLVQQLANLRISPRTAARAPSRPRTTLSNNNLNTLVQHMAGLRISPPRASGARAARFRNLPQNVVRLMIHHMNGMTAARFAAASKEYSANARARVKVTTNAYINSIVRQLAGRLLLAVKHIQTNQWRQNQLWGGRSKFNTTLAGVGNVSVKLGYGPFNQQVDHIYVTRPKVGSATLDVRRKNGHYVLSMSTPIEFFTLYPERNRLFESVVRRAIALYNAAPV